MSDKPSYLGLLNSLSLAESAAGEYLSCWIAATEHEGVRQTLTCVAARETEHGAAFAKRITELGYSLIPKERDESFAKSMKIASSTTMTDLEKFEALGYKRNPKKNDADNPDVFAKFFFNHDLDVQTGELLGRYICEERDSGKRLNACYAQLVAECEAGMSPSGDVDDRISALDAKIDAVCAVVTELRDALVTPSSNGSKSKVKANA
jgi:rubrerythrin